MRTIGTDSCGPFATAKSHGLNCLSAMRTIGTQQKSSPIWRMPWTSQLPFGDEDDWYRSEVPDCDVGLFGSQLPFGDEDDWYVRACS